MDSIFIIYDKPVKDIHPFIKKTLHTSIFLDKKDVHDVLD